MATLPTSLKLAEANSPFCRFTLCVELDLRFPPWPPPKRGEVLSAPRSVPPMEVIECLRWLLDFLLSASASSGAR